MLQLARLTVFREVAVQGSFTMAADALGCVQPSMSHQVLQFGRDLDAELFEREPRRARLTPAGRVSPRHVQAVLVQHALGAG